MLLPIMADGRDEPVRPITGLRARDIAAAAIAPEARANVIAVLGPRVDTYIAPLDWYVWFYMPDAAQQGRRVHVVGDQVREIKEGLTEVRRLRLVPYKPSEIIPAAEMVVDTAQILSTLGTLEPLKGHKIVGTSFELRHSPAFGQAVWNVDVYIRFEDEAEKFGRVVVGARTGQVLSIQPED